MMKIALVTCSSDKLDGEHPAKELYTGIFFRGAYAYAKKLQADKIFILSAKHKLLEEDAIIEKYDCTLYDMSAPEVRAWADEVYAQLCEKTDIEKDEFIILAGGPYRKYLANRLPHVCVPLEHMNRGKQVKFYTELLEEQK